MGGVELDCSSVGEMLCSASGLSGAMAGVDEKLRRGGGVSDDVTLASMADGSSSALAGSVKNLLRWCSAFQPCWAELVCKGAQAVIQQLVM